MNKRKGAFAAIILAALAYAGSAGAISAPLAGYQTHNAYYTNSSYTALAGAEVWSCDGDHVFIGVRSRYFVPAVSPCGNAPSHQTHWAYYSDNTYTALIGTETWNCSGDHLVIGVRSNFLVPTVSSCGDGPSID
ncbi:MAG: hypothetical protein ABL934_02790 [Lysobacteraceae bacterium]